MSTKTFGRRIPNILKSNPKIQKIAEKTSDETGNVFNNVKENVQYSFNQITVLNNSSPEKKCIKKDNKHRRSSGRRKQEHSCTDMWQESLSWNMYSFTDGKEDSKTCIKKRKSKYYLRKRNNKCKVLPLKIEEPKDNSLSSMSHDISKESTSEFHDDSFLEETEVLDLQNPIDFSSNEIFSNFNYKFQDVNEMTSFTEYTMDSDETFNSFDTMCDNKFCEEGYDINCNYIDIHKPHCSTSTESCAKDVQLLYDKEPSCSSDCCSYCLEDCASHWLATSELKHMISMQNRIVSENCVTTKNEINHQGNTGTSNMCISKIDTHSTVDTLEEESDKNNTYWLTTFTPETFSSCEFQSTESSCIDINNCYNQKNIQRTTLEILTTVENKECNTSIDDNNTFPTDVVFHESDENIEKYEEDTLQDQEYSEEDTINEEFQCLLCPLTFSSTRTVAIHQAAAHGGTYIILCESCGRLFNRKYHFNRHFIHCGRLKEPFKCDMCIKTYRHRSSLIQHLKSSHDVHYAHNRSKIFTCSICKKIYSKLGAFENHMKRHKNK